MLFRVITYAVAGTVKWSPRLSLESVAVFFYWDAKPQQKQSSTRIPGGELFSETLNFYYKLQISDFLDKNTCQHNAPYIAD